MKRKKIHCSIIAAALLFAGCWGSSGWTVSSNNTVLSAQLVDSNVSGVSYNDYCGNIGTTDADGTFLYSSNCEVEFKIGSLVLGTIQASNINNDKTVYPQDLLWVDRNNTTDPKVIQMAQLLQSLDNDNNASNGIVIEDNVADTFISSTLDFSTNLEISTNELNTSIVTAWKTLKSAQEAIAHLRETLRDNNITIQNNTPVVTMDSSITLDENGTIDVSYSIIDNDNDIVSVSITQAPTSGTVVVKKEESKFQYTPNINYIGEDSFIVRFDDGHNGIVEETISLMIQDSTAPSQPVVLVSLPTMTNQDTVEVSISGEPLSTIFINEIEAWDINSSWGATITLDTSGDDGTKAFTLFLKDSYNNESDVLNISIEKDATAPIVSDAVYSTTTLTNWDVTTTFQTDEDLTPPTGWSKTQNEDESYTYSKTYTTNTTETVTFADSVGNETQKEIVVNNIDKIAPTVSEAQYSTTTLTNWDVTTTFQTNEDLTPPTGWSKTQNEDESYTYSKTYTTNTTETVTFTDSVGNETQKEIVVNNIDKIAPTIVKHWYDWIPDSIERWTSLDFSIEFNEPIQLPENNENSSVAISYWKWVDGND